MYESNCPPKDICAYFNRSEGAIAARLIKPGKISEREDFRKMKRPLCPPFAWSPEERATHTSFAGAALVAKRSIKKLTSSSSPRRMLSREYPSSNVHLCGRSLRRPRAIPNTVPPSRRIPCAAAAQTPSGYPLRFYRLLLGSQMLPLRSFPQDKSSLSSHAATLPACRWMVYTTCSVLPDR